MIALVTGANKGIGYEIAAGLGGLGYRVGVGARDATRRETAVGTLRAAGVDAFGVPLDVTDDGSVTAAAELIERLAGRLDALVNNSRHPGRNGPGMAAGADHPRPGSAPHRRGHQRHGRRPGDQRDAAAAAALRLPTHRQRLQQRRLPDPTGGPGHRDRPRHGGLRTVEILPQRPHPAVRPPFQQAPTSSSTPPARAWSRPTSPASTDPAPPHRAQPPRSGSPPSRTAARPVPSSRTTASSPGDHRPAAGFRTGGRREPRECAGRHGPGTPGPCPDRDGRAPCAGRTWPSRDRRNGRTY